MTTAADPAISALRAVHNDLAARVNGYGDSDLARPSGATEWTLAQVLSHIGSGAEITRAGLETALAGTEPAGPTFNQSVWDRWNAMTAQQQTKECLASDAALLGAYQALDDATRSSLQIALPFLPAPVGLDLACALRLNESALHLWDLAVADDPSAQLHPAAVPILLDALSGPLSFLIGFIGSYSGVPCVLSVVTADPARDLTLRLDEKVSLEPYPPGAPDGTLVLPAEALVRLLTGRLRPEHTPAGVALAGPLGLAELRAAFPGF